MKIGIFDSGIGGLLILKEILDTLPDYDYVYLGDTARVPYGDRSHEEIYTFTKEAVDFLFQNGCTLIILACNTASARALRKLQREYLPHHYPERRILGVIIPAAEEAVLNSKTIAVLATTATVESNTFREELKKIHPDVTVYQIPAPKLVPLIENGTLDTVDELLHLYLDPVLDTNIDALILGCTHYVLLEKNIRAIIGDTIKIINQGTVVPEKLKLYLEHHPEIETLLNKKSTRELYATHITPQISKLAHTWFGDTVNFKQIIIEK